MKNLITLALLIATSTQVFSMDNDDSQKFKDACKKHASEIIKIYEEETFHSLKTLVKGTAFIAESNRLEQTAESLINKYEPNSRRIESLNIAMRAGRQKVNYMLKNTRS